ncbi:MAG TPA: hypothetical protein VK864_03990, partial [Longimicrobiales bacterium]|nr:hypothetical protein [Longimicrobiales bacterium]
MTPTVQKSLLPPPRLFWLGIVPLWTLWGLWSAQQNLLVTILSDRPVTSWTRPFGIALSAAWFWALLTPILMWVTRRFRDRISAPPARIAAHLGTFAVVHALDVVVYNVITNIAGTAWRPFPALFFSLVTFNALTYIVVAFGTTALDYQTALRER